MNTRYGAGKPSTKKAQQKKPARGSSIIPHGHANTTPGPLLPPPPPIDEVSILFFPLNVRRFYSPSAAQRNKLTLHASQMNDFPNRSIAQLGGRGASPKFSLEPISLGRFFEWTSKLGLIFDIKFTDEELQELPSWQLFNRKITAGISSLRPNVTLPTDSIGGEVTMHTTTWTFLELKTKNKQAKGRVQRLFVPPTEPLIRSDFCLDKLINVFGVINTIARPNDDHVPDNLIVIGV